ncbi:MAG TPA: wax ester/triacylglycerol synthase family O-acyltransferase [Solirubrobacteraceae bacterium]|jgi:WS/DGAT/MGAT family acyltransferase|nr:wax ester/triacylglycerol synthase family O-acyltransferase [Solirubrobacteraceae bacterium]
MAQQHLDRLTSIDASFLHQEGHNSHMHIGGVLVFEGPPPPFEDYLEHVRGRLHKVPRYRQKLATPPLETGRPLWVDDPCFNLEYHVRQTALPAPGTEEQLLLLTARIASQPLDRTKPLWESWMIEGLEPREAGGEERFALIFKTHHSLVDGVSGVDLATVLLDLEAKPEPPSEDIEPWRPASVPGPVDLVVSGLRSAVGTGVGLIERAAGVALDPIGSAGALRSAVQGLSELAWAALNPAPDTPLNVPIGPHRRFAVVRQQLADYKEIKNAFGGTVNDVVLSVVSGALARWLRNRGVRTEGLEMRALVPVSVRGDDQKDALGNRLTVMRGPLPVYIDDPVTRLGVVRQGMDGLKESKQAVGAATLAAVNHLAPPTILAQASRLQFSTRLFNLLVTNIPGPQFPLYVLGRPLEDLFPLAFLPENHALAVAIMSYNGGIDYGLLGDYDAMSDIELMAEWIDEALQELLERAREQAGGGTLARGKRRSSSSRSKARAGAGSGKNGNRSPRAEGNGREPAAIVPSGRRRSDDGPAAAMRAKHGQGRRRSPGDEGAKA